MPKTTCKACASDHTWKWEEAFDKFGFNDGDGIVRTDAVVTVLENGGYAVTSHQWGWHNTIISSVKRGDLELILVGTKVGYDDPRRYLPEEVVELLDAMLPEDAEAETPSGTKRTRFNDGEIEAIWASLSEMQDELLTRNGDNFRARTVDIIGRAEHVLKLIDGED